MKYHFKTLEQNGLKGIIGEQLARRFIRHTLIPRLKEDGSWDQVVFSRNNHKQRNPLQATLFTFDTYRTDFFLLGFYATTKLLSRYAMAIGILDQARCSPDGFLLKLQTTEDTRKVQPKVLPPQFKKPASSKGGAMVEFPIVEGDLEIVEIKCGRKARLMKKQKHTYNTLIAKDIPLRLVNVKIVSFDRNQYLVEEHLYRNFL